MPEETQNPDSWFRQARLAAGLTLTGVARELDAPIQTVHRWEQGGNRPPWPWPRKIADIFHRPVEEAVEGLLREVVGHPCGRPHNCGGTKILPDDPLVLETLQPSLRRFAERALTLLVKVTCARCGRPHAYPASGPHPKLCPRCSKVLKVDKVTGSFEERVEHIPCTCQGYHRYGRTTYFGPSCQRERAFTPGEANEFNSGKKRPRKPWRKYRHLEDGKIRSVITSGRYTDVKWERPFINLSDGTFRCKSCSFASIRFHVHKAPLEEISGKKIRSEAQQERLWKEYYTELTPGFSWQDGLAARRKLLRTKDGKEKLYGERHRAATSRGKTIAHWYHPRKELALCPICGQLTYGTRFHHPCYNSVRGQVRKGAYFRPRKTGPSANHNENLGRAFSWAVRHLLGEYHSEIARDAHQDLMFVTREIERICSLIPEPEKLSPRSRFKKVVLLLREAIAQKGFATSNAPQARAQSGVAR